LIPEVAMRILDTNDMLQTLENVPEGSVLFVSYVAGRPSTERAIAEAVRHTEDPTRPRRYFLGELSSVWQAKNGDWILTMHVWNRDTTQKDGSLKEGGYRSFNPNLGQLVLIDLIRKP
jgi:hypothetical protein